MELHGPLGKFCLFHWIVHSGWTFADFISAILWTFHYFFQTREEISGQFIETSGFLWNIPDISR